MVVSPFAEDGVVLVIEDCEVCRLVIAGSDVGLDFARAVFWLGVLNKGELFLIVLEHLGLGVLLPGIVNQKLAPKEI